jgi:poly-gamma-glutamate synthesis protein (capsule biosynthesis protein)
MINSKKIRFAAVGDLLLTSFKGKPEKDLGSVSDELVSVFKSCDIVFANLECTLQGTKKTESEPRVTAVNSQIASLKKAGVNIVSLANNHTFDCYNDGFINTVEQLKQQGVKYSGAGMNEKEAFDPVVTDIKGIKTAFLSFADKSSGMKTFASGSSPGAALLDTKKVCEKIQKASKIADHVIVSLHWGFERFTIPSPEQISQARKFIDSGASVLIGHHPHVLQGMEVYRNAPVLYSLGNFISNKVGWDDGDFLTWNRFERTGCLFTADLDGESVCNIKQIPVYDDGKRISIDRSKIGSDYIKRVNTLLEKGITGRKFLCEKMYVELLMPIRKKIGLKKIKNFNTLKKNEI